MRYQWQHREQDMRMAQRIIEKHLELRDDEPLEMVEMVITDNGGVDFNTPDWVIELAEHFDEAYGYEEGHQVTQQVLTEYLLAGETIH